MFLSCETQINKTEFYYPDKSSFESEADLIDLKLDSFKNYGELTSKMDANICNGKTSVLKFSDKKSEFNLIAFQDCSESNISPLYWNRNTINIQNDSIIIDNDLKTHFNSLSTVLKKHLINSNKDDNYSIDKEKAVIFYYQNDLFEIEKVKEQLIKMATEFNELNKKSNDKLSLKIKMKNKPYKKVETPPLPER